MQIMIFIFIKRANKRAAFLLSGPFLRARIILRNAVFFYLAPEIPALLSSSQFLLAPCAQSIELQFMALNFESIFTGHILLQRFNALILEFDD